MIFGMKMFWCVDWFFGQTARLLAFYVNVVLKTVIIKRSYCILFDNLFCLNAVRIKATTRNTMYTIKFDNTLSVVW